MPNAVGIFFFFFFVVFISREEEKEQRKKKSGEQQGKKLYVSGGSEEKSARVGRLSLAYLRVMIHRANGYVNAKCEMRMRWWYLVRTVGGGRK